MPSQREVPKVSPGQLPPPSSSSDSAFKAPLLSPRKTPTKIHSPKKICASPGLEQSDSESDGEESSSSANSGKKELLESMDTDHPSNKSQKRPSPSTPVKSEPGVKRSKFEFSISRHKGRSMFSSAKSGVAQYKHTWRDGDDPELKGTSTAQAGATSCAPSSSRATASFCRQPSAPDLATKSTMKSVSFARHQSFGNVAATKKVLLKGEAEDFRQDFDYFMSTMTSSEANENIVYLSLLSIVKKSVKHEFRSFLREKTAFFRVLNVIQKHLNSKRICAATTVFVYFMARDRNSFTPDESFATVLHTLIAFKPESNNPGLNEALDVLYQVLNDWSSTMTELGSKAVNHGMTRETFNISFLALESLAFILNRKQHPSFQSQLMNSGCLQVVVARVDKLAKKLAKFTANSTVSTDAIKELNRCLKILEHCALLSTQNQSFLVTCGDCILLHSCCNLIQIFQKFAIQGDTNAKSVALGALCSVDRVLMNLTHENELCCIKLGNIQNFLPTCVHTVTEIAPKYASKDIRFDLILMSCALLFNLAEKAIAIRKQILNMTTEVFDENNKTTTSQPALNAFVELFIYHEQAARTIDEELDKELEMPEEFMLDEDSNSGAMPDNKAAGSEDNVVNAIQTVMSKADSHMEGSVLASYYGLLVGCLVQRDSERALSVKKMIPGNTLTPLIEQLDRFKDFMVLMQKRAAKTTNLKTLERILGALQGYNAL